MMLEGKAYRQKALVKWPRLFIFNPNVDDIINNICFIQTFIFSNKYQFLLPYFCQEIN